MAALYALPSFSWLELEASHGTTGRSGFEGSRGLHAEGRGRL